MSLEKALEICQIMLKKRDYAIISTDDPITATKPDETNVAVFQYDNGKFGTSNLKELINDMNNIGVYHGIVLHTDDVTSAVKNSIKQLDDLYIELFHIEDLQYDITEHRLQPIFERLSDKEAAKFRKKYGLQFGTLRVDKPIARFYDYRKGDVIKITRKSGEVYYRIVKGL